MGFALFRGFHERNPYVLRVNGTEHRVDYEPGESKTGIFGGNSNWRGPIWFPLNFLLIESLQRFHHYFGETFTVEFPTGSGRKMTLWQVAAELSRRLTSIFVRDGEGMRPANRNLPRRPQGDPYWGDLVLFYEYFHGDSGGGLGESSNRLDRISDEARAAEPQTEGLVVPAGRSRISRPPSLSG
jgi:hypothetical protein